MWSTAYTQLTDVEPEKLWGLLSDVNGWGSWNSGIETIALQSPLAVGATFRMKPPGEDVLTSTIVELEENRLLTDVTELGDIVVRVRHRLEPQPGGGTAATYDVEVDGSASDAVCEEVGTAISADFPEVIAALIAAAGAR